LETNIWGRIMSNRLRLQIIAAAALFLAVVGCVLNFSAARFSRDSAVPELQTSEITGSTGGVVIHAE